jgi:hypothetical protein
MLYYIYNREVIYITFQPERGHSALYAALGRSHFNSVPRYIINQLLIFKLKEYGGVIGRKATCCLCRNR